MTTEELDDFGLAAHLAEPTTILLIPARGTPAFARWYAWHAGLLALDWDAEPDAREPDAASNAVNAAFWWSQANWSNEVANGG